MLFLEKKINLKLHIGMYKQIHALHQFIALLIHCHADVSETTLQSSEPTCYCTNTNLRVVDGQRLQHHLVVGIPRVLAHNVAV